MPPGRPLRSGDIVAAARALVRGGGVEGLSLRRLADGLDVSPAALYAHFPTKRDLLAAVARTELGEELDVDVDGAVVATDDPAGAALALWSAARAIATAVDLGVDPATIDAVVGSARTGAGSVDG